MNKLNIAQVSFSQLKTLPGFSMIVLGAGGELQDWVNGIAEMLQKEKIVKEQIDTFSSAAVITGNILGSEGRRDLLLTFNPAAEVEVGKLAMWRLRFGDISWLEDYTVNYAKDFGFSIPSEAEVESED